MDEDFLKSDYVQEILEFHCPRYNELPGLDLYMDQVLSVIEEVMKPFHPEEKAKTSSMVNNYVKQKIVTPPVNKKYSRKHIAYLLVVCILKRIFSISDICRLITIQIETYPLEKAYDFFCEELERALKAAFWGENTVAVDVCDEAALVRSAALCFAQKVRVQKYLEYRAIQNPEEAKKGKGTGK